MAEAWGVMKLEQDHNCLLGDVLEFRFQPEDNEENWEVMKSNFCFRLVWQQFCV